MYKFLIKPLLFRLGPEKAHHFSLSIFRKLSIIPGFKNVLGINVSKSILNQPKKVFGIQFPNPVGLAAGFDKDGKYYSTMQHLGFGFIEIGTVTPRPQSGNPKPRLFRLPSDGAVINRMGFNNEGVDAMVRRIQGQKHNFIIGGNIGKNKDTAIDAAIEDYEICFEKLYPHVDYFVVNVSSPNTPNLRSLQSKKPLTELLSSILELRSHKETIKPVLLKIAPDLTDSQIDDVLDVVDKTGIDGIIATNTTISREGLNTNTQTIQKIGNGGLSGAPLRNRSLEVVKLIKSKRPDLPVIGVGGIHTPQAALDMLEAGADLIQVYTGLIYEGPQFVKKVLTKIKHHK